MLRKLEVTNRASQGLRFHNENIDYTAEKNGTEIITRLDADTSADPGLSGAGGSPVRWQKKPPLLHWQHAQDRASGWASAMPEGTSLWSPVSLTGQL